jgi:hypothetical protein
MGRKCVPQYMPADIPKPCFATTTFYGHIGASVDMTVSVVFAENQLAFEVFATLEKLLRFRGEGNRISLPVLPVGHPTP